MLQLVAEARNIQDWSKTSRIESSQSQAQAEESLAKLDEPETRKTNGKSHGVFGITLKALANSSPGATLGKAFSIFEDATLKELRRAS